MARPKKENPLRQIGAMVPPDIAETIRVYAESFRLSQSWIIHRLLARGLAAVEADGFLIDPAVPLPKTTGGGRQRRRGG